MSTDQPQAVPANFRLLNFQVQESHLAYNILSVKEESAVSYNVDFTPSGRISRTQGQFALQLIIKITSTPDTFNARLTTYGSFAFNLGVDKVHLDNLVTKNSMAMVFPYIRAYIAGLTALSGFPTITIPTYNLTALAEPLRAAIEEIEAL